MIDQIFAYLKAMSDRARSRRRLRELSEEQLRDIGISRREAETEATRLPWETFSSHPSRLAGRPRHRIAAWARRPFPSAEQRR